MSAEEFALEMLAKLASFLFSLGVSKDKAAAVLDAEYKGAREAADALAEKIVDG